MVVSVFLLRFRDHKLTVAKAHHDGDRRILLYHVGRLAETPSELQAG
jgi:hypothetical protein